MLSEFFSDLFCWDGLMLPAVLAAFLAAIACGTVGSYVVVKRCSYMVGAISHSLLGGIGLACFCKYKWPNETFTPFVGSILAAVVAAALVTWLANRKDSRQDTALSAIWTLGTAIGLSFVHAIPGYGIDLDSYLFGSILLVSHSDLLLMAVLDIILLITIYLFHNRFLYFCFNEEGLQLRGISLWRTGLMLNILIAVTVVLLAQIVGLILCLALLILPVATAALFCHSLNRLMIVSGIICFLTVFVGLIASYGTDLPTGTFIVEISGVVYIIALLINYFRRMATSR